MALRSCGPALLEGMRAGFYDIIVTPADRSVRKKSDQMVERSWSDSIARSATLSAKLRVRANGSLLPMMPQPSGVGFEFLFAGLPDRSSITSSRMASARRRTR